MPVPTPLETDRGGGFTIEETERGAARPGPIPRWMHTPPNGGMPVDLLAERAAILQDFANREKYTPKDWIPGVHSAKPVAFVCDDRIKVVGDCVPVILAALQSWVEPPPVEKKDEFGETVLVPYRDEYPVIYERARKVLKRTLHTQPPPAELDFHSGDWNALNYLLDKVGCSCIFSQGHD